jgi:hypothetical protein
MPAAAVDSNRAARSTRLMHMERAATRDARPVAAKRVLVGRDGFEPSTSGLKVRCSTD